MIIGVPKEIKNHEYRLDMVPASVRELPARNHTVFVQSGAGSGIGLDEADYRAVGDDILVSAAAVFAKTG
ncbi:alanine dehydrogenase and pyridine nucleotide transhydrogenase [Aeromonas salmonicida]|uniref:alanine dehydrogenase n=1 Tax=Aeromonas salmonicida TaxID=645 RepID=UPI0010271A8A|nr:alanine dehydrogenase [Aeromonas salmonicida]VFB10894.1 alanine dehydrogenase and pyridine nucleotide transhydrogenase [Aeromonas salmonicida]